MFVVAAVFIALAWQQHYQVARYSINLMLDDQWDFYIPVFRGLSAARQFDWQHGPHRQGLGLPLTAALARWSGWNSRWDALAASLIIIIAAGLGLAVARRCGVRPALALVVVPLLFFNAHQFETFIGPANLSYSALPMLLLMAYCLAWFIQNRAIRILAVLAINFLLLFTGMGLFVGFITPLLLIIEEYQAARSKQWARAWWISAALAAALGSWGLFFINYAGGSALRDVRFSNANLLKYLEFVTLMLANFHGLQREGPVAVLSGTCALTALAVICFSQGYRLLVRSIDGQPREIAIFCCSAFALLFCVGVATGRLFAGLDQGPYPSRYVTLMIPAGLAIFLYISTLPNRRLSGLLVLFYGLLLTWGVAFPSADDAIKMQWYHDSRLAWKTNYIATHDVAKASQAAHGFRVHPYSDLHDRLLFLDQHRLNLFNSNATP